MNIGCYFVLSVLTVCLAKQETHRFIHVEKDGKAIAQDIIHDQEANTVMIIIGDVSRYEGYIPTVNLHDFNTGYVAFKGISHKFCMLSKTPYPRAMPEVYKMGITNITMEYTAVGHPTPLSLEDVEDIAGSRIAEFCGDYLTYARELIPIKQSLKRGAVDPPDTDTSSSGCIICLWCVIKNGIPTPVSEPDSLFG